MLSAKWSRLKKYTTDFSHVLEVVVREHWGNLFFFLAYGTFKLKQQKN